MSRNQKLLVTALSSSLLALMLLATWQAVFGPWTFPHDEGLTGLTAVNVLQGQLPHVDFVDPYSGGSALLHALMYRLFGIGIIASRYALFAASLGLAIALVVLARSKVSDPAAIFAAAMALAWGPVVYMTALPSWYNLAAMAIGAACLHIGLTRHSYTAIVVAGIFGGFSVMAKVSGAYYCIGAVLYLLLDAGYRSGRNAVPAIGATVAAIFVLLITLKAISISIFIYFLLPALAAATFVAWPKQPPEAGLEAPAQGWRRISAFLFGFGLVVGPWILIYAWHSQLGALWNGLVVLPSLRLDFASRPLPPLATSIGALLIVALYLTRTRLSASSKRIVDLCIVAGLLSVLFVSRIGEVYQWTWLTIRWLLPITTLVYFAARLYRLRRGDQVIPDTTDLLWILVAFGSLIQFPFSFALYFMYIAPMFIVALFLSTASGQERSAFLPWAIAGFIGFFCIHTVHGGSVAALASAALPRPPMKLLDLPRAGIPVPEYDQAVYGRIASLVAMHGGDGPILAYPDCPEVAFLAGAHAALRSPYRFMAPAEVSREGLERSLADGGLHLAVLNTQPEFSPPITDDEYAAIEAQLPIAEDVGHFRVMWRSNSDSR